MSGGSWDYVTFKISEAAGKLEHEKSSLRRALAVHMNLVALAMYEIEWVDSGDMSPGDEVNTIKKVLGASSDQQEIEVLLSDARETIAKLKKLGA